MRAPVRFAVGWLAVAVLAGAWAPGGGPGHPPRAAEGMAGRRVCRAAAARARFPVACPRTWHRGALPFWANGVGGRACGGGHVTRRRWTWVGTELHIGRRYGEILVGSAPGEVAPDRLVQAFAPAAAIVGRHADGHTYAVAVSGRLHDRRLAAAVARTIVLVSPDAG